MSLATHPGQMPPQGFSTHPPGSRSRAPLNLPGLSKCCTHRTAAAPFGHLDPRGSSQSTCIASCQTKAAPQVLATAMATAVSGPRPASMGTGSLPHRGPGAQSNQGPRGLLCCGKPRPLTQAPRSPKVVVFPPAWPSGAVQAPWGQTRFGTGQNPASPRRPGSWHPGLALRRPCSGSRAPWPP